MPSDPPSHRTKDLDAGLQLARGLFHEIGRRTFDGVGLTRAMPGLDWPVLIGNDF